jgi:hypothetical protein
MGRGGNMGWGSGGMECHFCFLDFGYVCVGVGEVGPAYIKHCGW